MSRGVIGSDWRDPRANDDLHGTWVASGDRCVCADASKWLAIPEGLPTFLSLEPRPRSFPDLPNEKNHSSSNDGIVISTSLPHARAVQPRLTSLGTYRDPLDDCSLCLSLYLHHSFRVTAHGASDPFAFYTLSSEIALGIRTSFG